MPYTMTENHSHHRLHTAKCNSVFNTLLLMHHHAHFNSAAFVREFFETVRCDDVLDMSEARQEYVTAIGSDQLTKIKNYESVDLNKLDQVILQIGDTHRRRLLNGLPLLSQIYHRILAPVEHILCKIMRKN